MGRPPPEYEVRYCHAEESRWYRDDEASRTHGKVDMRLRCFAMFVPMGIGTHSLSTTSAGFGISVRATHKYWGRRKRM
jgi:hypothetical protein